MNYKILMVDDDRELLKMLNQYFTLKNYTVMIAENGIEAMEKISANPDIILLDVNMPGMDGIEVCRRIRDMVSCPIIFLTAKVDNVPFVTGDKDLDAKFVAEAKAAGFENLKGHRTVGGMRASIYNAMPKEGVEKLVEFMKKFEEENA